MNKEELSCELKFCPICGSKAKLINTLAGIYVVCSGKSRHHTCEAGPYRSEKLAIDTWNGVYAKTLKDNT